MARYRFVTDARHRNGDIATGHHIYVYSDRAMTTLLDDLTDIDSAALANPLTVGDEGQIVFDSATNPVWVIAEGDDDPQLLYTVTPQVVFEGQSPDLNALGYINVKDFGAIGDGVTNDQAAFEAAFAAQKAASVASYDLYGSHQFMTPSVFIPAGRYYVNGGFIFDYRGARVLGAGRTSTYIVTHQTGPSSESAATKHTFHVGPAALNLTPEYYWLDAGNSGSYFELHDMTIINDNYDDWTITPGGRKGTGVWDNAIGNMVLSNLEVRGYKYGFCAVYGHDFGNHYNNRWMWNDTNMYFGPGSEQVWVYGNETGVAQENVVLDGAGNILFSGCDFSTPTGSADVILTGGMADETTRWGVTRIWNDSCMNVTFDNMWEERVWDTGTPEFQALTKVNQYISFEGTTCHRHIVLNNPLISFHDWPGETRSGAWIKLNDYQTGGSMIVNNPQFMTDTGMFRYIVELDRTEVDYFYFTMTNPWISSATGDNWPPAKDTLDIFSSEESPVSFQIIQYQNNNRTGVSFMSHAWSNRLNLITEGGTHAQDEHSCGLWNCGTHDLRFTTNFNDGADWKYNVAVDPRDGALMIGDPDVANDRKSISYGATAPAGGTWAKGSIFFNKEPTDGDPVGWICTVSGTPGTWVQFGRVGSSSIVNADVATNAAVDPSKLAAGSNGQILTTTAGVAGWAASTGSFPGFGSTGYPVDVAATEDDGVSGLVARADHQHKLGIMTTKGDVLTHDGSTPVRLAVGTDGKVLTVQADGSVAWEDSPGATWGGAGYPMDVQGSEADGTATTAARSDHVHKYGAGTIENQHVATGADIDVGKLAHGTAGQVLKTDPGGTYALWSSSTANSPLTTKGDIYVYGSGDTRLPAPAGDGLFLTSASGQATGLAWGSSPSSQVFNVKSSSYGAHGDNSQDDYAHITNALSAASSAGGGTVYFPPGIYLCNSTLVIPDGVNLVGEGGFDGDTTGSFKGSWIKGNITIGRRHYIAGLKIGNNGATVSMRTGQEQYGVVFDRCRIRGGASLASLFHIGSDIYWPVHDIHILNCIFERNQGAVTTTNPAECWFDCVGDQTDSDSHRYNINIDNCWFGASNGVATGNSGWGIVFGRWDTTPNLSYTYAIRINGCTFEVTDDNTIDTSCEGSTTAASQGSYDLVFTNNFVKGGGNSAGGYGSFFGGGLSIEGTRRSLVANNYFGRCKWYSLNLTKDVDNSVGQGSQNIVIGNIFDDVTNYGMIASSSGTGIMVCRNGENLIEGNIFQLGATGHEMAIKFADETAQRNTVTGNKFIDARTDQFSTNTGMIQFQAGSNVSILANDIWNKRTANTRGGIFLRNNAVLGHTATRLVFQGNRIEAASSPFSPLDSGSFYTNGNWRGDNDTFV